jgi:hypothetical protein
VVHNHERTLHERGQQQDRRPGRVTDPFRRFELEPTLEDGQGAEQGLFVGREQVVAPRDRGTQRLVPGRRRAQRGHQHAEPVVQQVR